MGKILCWFWYSLLSWFWLTVLPLLLVWFLPDVGGAYFSTITFIKLDYFGDDTYNFLLIAFNVCVLILYFSSLAELFRGYTELNREVTKWSVGLGEFTSSKEKRKAKRAITWGVSSFVLFKSYIPGLLTLSGIANGLFYWLVLESTNKALISASVLFVLAFFISHLCGDYGEKINRIKDTIDYEFRNRSRYHGMREYVEDSDPYYRDEPVVEPRRRSRPQGRSGRQFTPQRRQPPRRQPPRSRRPPARREHEPLYYEQDYQDDYYDQEVDYQEPQPYQPPLQSHSHHQEPEYYYENEQDENRPDSFEDVLGDVPPAPRQPRRGIHSHSQSGGITEQLGKFFKHNKKRPF